MTVSQGSSAWLWKITARSRLGPSIAWLATITAPADGVSSPARMLSTVVLPQPEWPMMQTNSPRAIDSHRSWNTVVLPPPGAGKRLVMPSMEMNLSVMRVVMRGLDPRIHPFREDDGLHRNSGLPELRRAERRKSSEPD